MTTRFGMETDIDNVSRRTVRFMFRLIYAGQPPFMTGVKRDRGKRGALTEFVIFIVSSSVETRANIHPPLFNSDCLRYAEEEGGTGRMLAEDR